MFHLHVILISFSSNYMIFYFEKNYIVSVKYFLISNNFIQSLQISDCLGRSTSYPVLLYNWKYNNNDNARGYFIFNHTLFFKILERSLKLLFETRDISLIKQYVQRQCMKLLEGKASIQDFIFAKEYRGSSSYKPGACVPALELTR